MSTAPVAHGRHHRSDQDEMVADELPAGEYLTLLELATLRARKTELFRGVFSRRPKAKTPALLLGFLGL